MNDDPEEHLFQTLYSLRKMKGGYTFYSTIDEVLRQYNATSAGAVINKDQLLAVISKYSLNQKTSLGRPVPPFETRGGEGNNITHIGMIDRAYKVPSEWSNR
ncbi:TPA: hypothetical protein ACXR0D_001882 [Klebsiella variicola subsp. variicola]